MENIKEIWRNIEGYDGYQVSNMGRVKSLKYGKERILKYTKANKGYAQLTLSKNGIQTTYKIHRLVAEAFMPNPENKPQIDHINTDRTDNRVENLRWVTSKENCNNPITINNYSKCRKGIKSHNHRPIFQYDKEGNFIREWDTITEAETTLNLSHKISLVCQGKRNSCGGFIWKYKEEKAA